MEVSNSSRMESLPPDIDDGASEFARATGRELCGDWNRRAESLELGLNMAMEFGDRSERTQ